MSAAPSDHPPRHDRPTDPRPDPRPDAPGDPQQRLLDALLPHVPFEGWSEGALQAAAAELDLSPGELATLAPRGAPGLAALWHRRGDRQMTLALAASDLAALRFRDRVARAVRLRLEGADREVVRRSMALFALPRHAPEGARLLWETADAIWRALGDSSDDVNWYTKRLTLSGVLSATLLYWLGDTSEGAAATWAFLDRRIEGVMRFEKAKARLRAAPLLGRMLTHPLNPLTHLHAPRPGAGGWPGYREPPPGPPDPGGTP